MQNAFTRFAQAVARYAGHPATFLGAVLLIVVWALTGPLFHYSDAWQLVINTGTTIVTFLMVFLIQNSQNRDGLAIQLKLTELVIAQSGARNSLADLEDLTDAQLEELHQSSRRRALAACRTLENRTAARRKTAAPGAVSATKRSSKRRTRGTKT